MCLQMNAHMLKAQSFEILFWNIENFFDPYNDLATNDDEFTSFGEKHWNKKRFTQKRNDIAKSLILLTKGDLPEILAFSEVENWYVLNELNKNTPLSNAGYTIIHRDSPDPRGIDVALLYKRERFRILKIKYYNPLANKEQGATRLILYAKGVIDNLDTLHLMVNHWPSKLGGELKSAKRREIVASLVKQICDSIFIENELANIIIMGDLNDTPKSNFLKGFDKFFNPFENEREIGTIKFSGKWEVIDQFLISKNLLDRSEPISCKEDSFKILYDESLLEIDKEFYGYKPKRAYKGPRYYGGISDHLPIIMSINKNY